MRTTLRVIIALGKFQAVMIAQTPTGYFRARIFLPAIGEGMIDPLIRWTSSANHRRKEEP